MLELIVGLGYGLGQQWASLFSNGIAPPGTYIEVVGAALIFGFVAWQIPSLAGSLMNGAPRMTLGSFLSTAGAVAVGGVVVAGGIGAMIGGRTLSSSNSDTLRAAGDVGQPNDPLALTSSPESYRRDGQSSGNFADDLSHDPYARDSDTFDTHTPMATKFDIEESSAAHLSGSNATTDADVSGTDSASETSAQSRSSEDDDQSRGASTSDDSNVNEAEVTAEDAAQRRVSDAAIAEENDRMAWQAEQRDVQGGDTPPSPRINPTPSLRQPQIPDDSADDSIHIRFKHPE